MWFTVLGPVEVSSGGVPVELGRAQRRAVLAYLLLHSGRSISADQLVDALWGDAPPATARTQIQVAISAVRRALRAAGRDPIRSVKGGYQLTVIPDEFDFAQFTARVRAARGQGATQYAADEVRAALALWRGTPLSGVSAPYAAIVRAHLEEQLRSAYDLLFGIELDRGRHREVVPELTALAEAHPFREDLAGRLMLALYRAGRPADALAAYQQIRRNLVEELGVEPSASLRRLHQSVLTGDPALDLPVTATVVRGPGASTLPHDIPDFTGRTAALADLDAVPSAAVAVISGPGGVGKTALAVRWAHASAHRFPDGRFYVDLHGYGPRDPMPPAEALRHLLRALGFPAGDVPADVDAAAALYRARLAGSAALIVLDNAATADQVRPLLPGGPGPMVLVTSRDRLGGLIAGDGASRIVLGELAATESAELVTRMVGADRAAREPRALADLVAACGHLPLALRIAAANLADRPEETIREHADWLAAPSRLGRFAVAGDPRRTLHAVIDQSYERLTAAQQTVVRSLPALPGDDFGIGVVAGVLELTGDEVGVLLKQLVEAWLVVEPTPGRFTLHDLVREYAASRSAEHADVRTRALAWYVTKTTEAHQRIAERTPDGGSAFESAADAMAWFDVEAANLLAAKAVAVEHGHPAWSRSLGMLLRPYLRMRSQRPDWTTVCEVGLRSGIELDDASVDAQLLSAEDAVRRRRRQYAAARPTLERALELARGQDEAALAGYIQDMLATGADPVAEYADAQARLNQALALAARAADDHLAMTVHLSSGLLSGLRHAYPEAIEDFQRGLAIAVRLDRPQVAGVARLNIAYAWHRLGERPRAVEQVHRMIASADEAGLAELVARGRELLAAVDLG
ncbi:DNA-binding SARP family transcriptional activator [Hamadaea flava]|uniref:BTAD domain-containing putative transcriptional regulator n=1 Tax=Hamadaea flava TaxID=1742688 RepID=A0ABV8LU49_9ACTN|nr:BTAD domain-containing putative transcriptional regulator [Hamadaea flava]MCP2328280.1 DNA-binding SARP family transcriptional activator [Hamadaea flava]